MELAREHKQMAASNRSLELVAKITGSLAEEPKQLTGTVSVIHSLSDEVLEQLAAMPVVQRISVGIHRCGTMSEIVKQDSGIVT